LKAYPTVRVGGVLRLVRRPVAVEIDREYEEIGVRSFGRGIFHKDPVEGSALHQKRVFRIEPSDLVISNVFAWEGAIAVASQAESGRIGSHRFMTFVPIAERIDTAWASWFFRSEPGIELIRRASPGSAGRNRTLAIKRFEALEIPLPPIEEQRRVAENLDSVQASAATASKRLASHRAGVFSTALPGLIDELIHRVASGTCPVSELVDFSTDTVHPGDDPGPADLFVGLQHIESHTGRRTGGDPLGPMKGRKFRFRPGDVLYGYLRPYLNKVWAADRDGLCSVDQYVLRPRLGVSAQLLAHALRSRAVLAPAVELTHNLQLPRLRSGLLSTLEVPVVPPPQVDTLVARLDAVTDQTIRIAAKRQAQEALTRALVPAALNETFAGPAT
jgi:hypothetical protein